MVLTSSAFVSQTFLDDVLAQTAVELATDIQLVVQGPGRQVFAGYPMTKRKPGQQQRVHQPVQVVLERQVQEV